MWYHISHIIYHICHFSFRAIFHFVPFDISCHLTFRVIWHFMSLTFHIDRYFLRTHRSSITTSIVWSKWSLSHYSSHHVINDQSCYWVPVCSQKVSIYIIGHHHVKSSFGANNTNDHDDDDDDDNHEDGGDKNFGRYC